MFLSSSPVYHACHWAELVPEELRNRPKLSEEDIDHHHDFDNEDADISKLWSAWRSHLRDVLDQDQATEKDLISSFLPCFDKAPAFRHANKVATPTPLDRVNSLGNFCGLLPSVCVGGCGHSSSLCSATL